VSDTKVMKPTDPPSSDSHTRVTLEAQVRALRRQVSQRERALALLNRRLLRLEHGEDALPGLGQIGATEIAGHVVLLRSQLASLHDENEALKGETEVLKNELRWLRNSRIFRWSRSFRGAFYAVRRVFRRR
jgi:chromosome segregation ATPase